MDKNLNTNYAFFFLNAKTNRMQFFAKMHYVKLARLSIFLHAQPESI